MIREGHVKVKNIEQMKIKIAEHTLINNILGVIMLETKTVAIFTILVALSSSHQYDPDVVEWFPHQYDCSKFMISFHGNEIGA